MSEGKREKKGKYYNKRFVTDRTKNVNIQFKRSFIPDRFTVTRVNRRVIGRCFNSIVDAESVLYTINELKIGYYLSILMIE